MPPKIRDKPVLLSGLSLFYDAFWDVATCRPSPGSLIPWTAINSWAEAKGLDEETRGLLHRYIRKMDLAFLEWLRSKSAKDAKRKEREDGNA